ncbi:hypothetical protein [Enterococcus sp. AZ196]|uniref:hypothetical protein n=1 Tax=Enterococcus sp. AZ196 TaxID=2774659 RepID=UPI003D275232
MTPNELMDPLIKATTGGVLLLVTISAMKIIFEFLITLGNGNNVEKAVAKSVEEKKENRDRTIREYLEHNKNLEGLGFNNKLYIYVYCPYKDNVWIENFFIDIEDSSVTITDQNGRTYACSINNIKKIKSVDLDTNEKLEENLNSYNPIDEFWSPKRNEEIEGGEDMNWCDF